MKQNCSKAVFNLVKFNNETNKHNIFVHIFNAGYTKNDEIKKEDHDGEGTFNFVYWKY